MANRRMFSLNIINSARFLRMPHESQSLYFHLGLRADDDGIVEAYSVMKLLGAKEDNLNVLSSKGFIKILNDDLVSFIIDWKEHNLIRADRKVDSVYKTLLLQVMPEVDLTQPQPRADTGLLTQSQIRSSTKYLPSNFKGRVLPFFDNKPCPVCQNVMKFAGGRHQTSIQHNKAISRGGEHRIENISVICFDCNMRLKSKDTEELNNKEVRKIWEELNGQQMDVQMSAQDSIVEDRIVKDNKSQKSAPKFDVIDLELSTFLRDLILKNIPTFKEPNLDQWASHIKLMRERDNRTEEQIRFVIEWCQKDNFWQANILSTKKLREKFDTLVAQIKRKVSSEQIKKSNIAFS